MRIQKVTEYISRSHRELSKIAKKEHANVLYLWYDFIKCSIVHGAIINHYCRGGLYKLKGCERKKSLTYRRILKIYNKCNDPSGIPLLNNKHLFNSHFDQFISRDWLFSQQMSELDFTDFCNKHDSAIIKPETGVEGTDIKKIQLPKKQGEISNLFNDLKAKPCMIEEIIIQHPDMIFNNSSVNTIRAHSIIDSSGNVHILKMLLRAGVGNSIVDNYAHGGCVYEIDISTGYIISPSLMKTGEEVFIHSGSNIVMLGKKVPNWDKVISAVKQAHRLLPQCRFIGWDVAITKDDIELIEGNHNPDYELYEFFGSKGWWAKIKKYI